MGFKNRAITCFTDLLAKSKNKKAEPRQSEDLPMCLILGLNPIHPFYGKDAFLDVYKKFLIRIETQRKNKTIRYHGSEYRLCITQGMLLFIGHDKPLSLWEKSSIAKQCIDAWFAILDSNNDHFFHGIASIAVGEIELEDSPEMNIPVMNNLYMRAGKLAYAGLVEWEELHRKKHVVIADEVMARNVLKFPSPLRFKDNGNGDETYGYEYDEKLFDRPALTLVTSSP
jgi:hypothetical protein